MNSTPLPVPPPHPPPQVPLERQQEFLSQAVGWKEAGNRKMKEGNFREAVDLYTEGLGSLHLASADCRKQELLVALHGNLAQAYLNLGEFDLCVSSSKVVVSIDRQNKKAFWRLGQAYLLKKEIGHAADIATEGLEFAPHDFGLLSLKKEAEEALVRRLRERRGEGGEKEVEEEETEAGEGGEQVGGAEVREERRVEGLCEENAERLREEEWEKEVRRRRERERVRQQEWQEEMERRREKERLKEEEWNSEMRRRREVQRWREEEWRREIERLREKAFSSREDF